MNFEEEKKFITVTDFSVSGESFDLLINEEYQILKTNPTPTPENLGKYYEFDAYISHNDTPKSTFEKIYQIVKKQAIQNKVKLINKQQPLKGTILDIGAGTGEFLLACQKKNWKAIGFEPNEKAKATAKNKGLTLVDDLHSLEQNAFDVITLWHVLEHIPDVEKQIAQLKKLLKPTGTVIIAVPNFKSYDAKHYQNFWAAYDVPRHLWHFSKTGIEKLFDKQNMNLDDVKPLWFDSFYVSLLSEKHKTGKLNYFKGFYIGFISNLVAFFKKEFSSHIYIFKNK